MIEPVPDSRAYVHRTCGEITDVSGGDFKNMATPVPGMLKTVCASCGRAFPVSEFQWHDTGEELVAYYERHRARVPALMRLLCSRPVAMVIFLAGFLLGIAAGVWAWNSLGVLAGLGIGLVASLVGAIATILIWDAFTDRILCRFLGTSDPRCLK